MLKGQSARLYYTVWSLATGEPVAGDLVSNTHTVHYCSGTTWTSLSVSPVEVGNGVYTFELSSDYTNVDSAVCRVSSSNEAVMIPPIMLQFESVSETDQVSIAGKILDGYITQEDTISSALSDVLSTSSSVYTLVTSMKAKLDLYPQPEDMPSKDDIPTAVQIAQSVLATNVPSNVGEYSVGAMVLGGFCSDLNPDTNTWIIRNPDNAVVAIKTFVTSDSMEPIISVR